MIDISIITPLKIAYYRPNTHCYPLEYLIDSALFALENKNNPNQIFEFKHDAEENGYCFWDIEIQENQKLILLIMMNPDIKLLERISELGNNFALKHYQEEIKFIKEDLLLAVELNTKDYYSAIYNAIKNITETITSQEFQDLALKKFPYEDFKKLTDKISKIK